MIGKKLWKSLQGVPNAKPYPQLQCVRISFRCSERVTITARGLWLIWRGKNVILWFLPARSQRSLSERKWPETAAGFLGQIKWSVIRLYMQWAPKAEYLTVQGSRAGAENTTPSLTLAPDEAWRRISAHSVQSHTHFCKNPWAWVLRPWSQAVTDASHTHTHTHSADCSLDLIHLHVSSCCLPCRCLRVQGPLGLADATGRSSVGQRWAPAEHPYEV